MEPGTASTRRCIVGDRAEGNTGGDGAKGRQPHPPKGKTQVRGEDGKHDRTSGGGGRNLVGAGRERI